MSVRITQEPSTPLPNSFMLNSRVRCPEDREST